jgi:non-specific serine/threonine protein kinase
MDRAAAGPADRRAGERSSSIRRSADGLDPRAASDGRHITALRALPIGQRPASGAPLARDGRPARQGWPHNLPHPLTSFIGREREIAEARRLLDTTRLLTLTGAGGVGKTRLGHQVATGLVDAFQSGVWLVELAGLADPTLVPQAIATVLGVDEEPGRPLTETLAGALSDEQLLLVPDNCEHLIEACAELADALLRACPGLRILATSRQPLGIAGETTFRVPSLALSAPPWTPTASAPGEAELGEPIAGPPPSPEWIEAPPEPEAVHLFVERARAAVPDFTLTDRNASAVEQICRRLDGIPLAIELAAARIAVLSPEQIAARLGDRFHLLTGGSRTALPRYRTLRALIDWSHDLLDEPEKVLLRRLGVFAGGWTLEAAEAVCAGADLASKDVLDLLSGLVAKSVVLVGEAGDEARYGFLESLREYAAETLRDAGEETTLHERHCAWLLELAERAEPDLSGRDAVRWLDRLEQERENVRAALTRSIEREMAEVGLRLAGALTQFWLVRGPYREIRGTLAELLKLPAARERSGPILAARAKALLAAGRLAMRQGDRTEAEVHFHEALEISRQLGDRRSLAIAQFSIGHVARVRGEYAAARSHHAEALQAFEALGDAHWLANTHHDLGLAAYFEGDLETARQQYEATLALSQRLGDEAGIASALNDLGEVACLRGEREEARALQGASLTMARKIDDKKLIAMTLAALAGIAVAQGKPTRGLRLAAVVTALDEATGQRHSPAWHAMLDRWLEPARRAMSAEACAAAEAAGRAMPLDEAIEYALSPDPSYEDAPRSAASMRTTPPSSSRPVVARAARAVRPAAVQPRGATNGLTSREQEVAVLVARGLTNPQIAAELVITRGTAANHVKHILARLGLDSRVQIAAWAVEHGLLGRAAS